MALPASREEFKEYCLRRLGKPVIRINVSDDQIEDRIDEALKFFWDYHFDGSEKIYYKHIINANTISNEYITLPDNINGVVRIFPIGTFAGTSGNMFSAEYQFALNDLYAFMAVSLVPYYMVRTHLQLIEELLVGMKPIRYNRHRNRLHIDMNWDKVTVGDYLVVEAYEVIDPDTFTDAWSDRWLLEYASEKIKYQWAENVGKYENMQLPGGITFSAQRMKDEATLKIRQLEEEMTLNYSIPPMDMVG